MKLDSEALNLTTLHVLHWDTVQSKIREVVKVRHRTECAREEGWYFKEEESRTESLAKVWTSFWWRWEGTDKKNPWVNHNNRIGRRGWFINNYYNGLIENWKLVYKTRRISYDYLKLKDKIGISENFATPY